jgi:hypothetical protein
VYQHALVLLDSALAIATDSPAVTGFAAMAKGRTLLNLGQYANAAHAVAGVPDAFLYQVSVPNRGGGYFLSLELGGSKYAVASSEGNNGLPFVTANDPRVQVTSGGTNQLGLPFFFPAKYPVESDPISIVLASGVEARLIEAEAALNTEMSAHSNDTTWLTILNALRTSCTMAVGCPAPAPAGTGGVAGLPRLNDPGSDTARVTLLFTERAYWLYLTGHRQGDLRRLIRNYGRSPNAVYPSGTYNGGSGFYGSDVNLPIPDAELNNPYFHGCLDRRA